MQPVLLDMMAALLPFVKVAVIVNDHAEKQEIRTALLERHPSALAVAGELQFHLVKHLEIWVRDFGPIFLKSATDPSLPLKVAVFRWNIWGWLDNLLPAVVPPEEIAELIAEGEVSRRVAQALSLATVDADFVSEGGNREFNGRGTLMLTEAVELQRNPHLTKEQLTERFQRLFNVRTVIWLKQGVAEDDHIFRGPLPGGVFNMPCTGGHVDEVCEEDRDHPIGRISHQRMEANYRILAGETDQDGRPFTIMRIPLPPIDVVKITPADPVFGDYSAIAFSSGKTFEQLLDELHPVEDDGDGDDVRSIEAVVPASYCNFVISNGVVLMPRYHAEGRDEAVKRTDDAARAVLQSAFPDRKIVQIDCENINFGGGGMHCVSQQQPAPS